MRFILLIIFCINIASADCMGDVNFDNSIDSFNYVSEDNIVNIDNGKNDKITITHQKLHITFDRFAKTSSILGSNKQRKSSTLTCKMN